MTRGRSNQRPLDIALDILSNQYRRRLLVALLEHNPQADEDTRVPVDATIRDEDMEERKILMAHSHLPKLEEAGFILWDRETNDVQNGPRFEEIRPLLELLRNHADELPDGWL